ncbi:MAG: SagB/ThcOx family dehydrogenase [Candidatus Omnitrophota bacterium]|nr:SagB/ThcOx family dehydrogenase [Candidatus Omnitrophota bacterium]
MIKMGRIKRYFLILIVIMFTELFFSGYFFKNKKILLAENKEELKLPSIQAIGKLSVEEAISKRRSVREYKDAALSLKEISCLLWAASGITINWGGRTTPSAGALCPLEIYLVAGRVENLKPGIYRYNPEGHSLIMIAEGDKRFALYSASLFQAPIKNAPISLVICAQYKRTTRKYGERGERYVHIEVGHAGQNIYLQAESLGLKTVAIGAFVDEAVKKVLNIKEEPLYIMPVGKKM